MLLLLSGVHSAMSEESAWLAGLDMGGLQFRQSNPSWVKEGMNAQNSQELQQQLRMEGFQRFANEAPHGGPSVRQLEALAPMKRSASADSMPPGAAEDVRHHLYTDTTTATDGHHLQVSHARTREGNNKMVCIVGTWLSGTKTLGFI